MVTLGSPKDFYATCNSVPGGVALPKKRIQCDPSGDAVGWIRQNPQVATCGYLSHDLSEVFHLQVEIFPTLFDRAA